MGVDEAWKCKGCGILIESQNSFIRSGGLGSRTGDLSAAASPTGQPRPAVSPSLEGKAEEPWMVPPMDWLKNPNDVMDGGNVEDGKALALEEAYAAPANHTIKIQHITNMLLMKKFCLVVIPKQ